MAIRKRVPEFQPWVENVAGLIADPVRRLRFLRAVAPVTAAGGHRHWWSRPRRVVLLITTLVAVLITFFAIHVSASSKRAPAVAAPTEHPAPSPPVAGRTLPSTEVWRVEKSGNSEVYSNGLRVDNTFAVAHRPRSYLAFPIDHSQPVQRSSPAGIVFHSTESPQAPFEAGHNDTLKHIGESLLDYVRRRQSYHFLIDRFGRVFRVVEESDAANHAGHSVWGDDRWFYLDLNDSFLGVAFESETKHDQGDSAMTAAQIRSAVMLTEMLRTRYRIAAADCVTHAQVSVNPSNMRIGYHVDWAANFPFEALGLPNNYGASIPAIAAFGFAWDPSYFDRADGRLRRAMEASAETLERDATASGTSPAAHRKKLQGDYREKVAAARH